MALFKISSGTILSILSLIWLASWPSTNGLKRPKTINASPGICRENGSALVLKTNRQSIYDSLDSALLVRGGDSPGESTGLVASIRSFFDKSLDSLQQQYPSIASYMRSFLLSIESLTGMELVSKPKKKKKKAKEGAKSSTRKTKRKPSKATSISTNDSEKETATASKTSSSKSSSGNKKKKSTTVAAKQKSGSKSLASAHVHKDLKATSPNYRIQRELKAFLSDPPPNLKVKVGKNLRVWIVTMKGAQGTIYEGETFQLRISFPAQYPTVPPSVYFLPPNIPLHEHVYTNGDICLSLLGKDWRPTMTAQSIAVSILSILSSAQSKSLPMDNARHAQNKPGEYQKEWVYHDDLC